MFCKSLLLFYSDIDTLIQHPALTQHDPLHRLAAFEPPFITNAHVRNIDESSVTQTATTTVYSNDILSTSAELDARRAGHIVSGAQLLADSSVEHKVGSLDIHAHSRSHVGHLSPPVPKTSTFLLILSKCLIYYN